MERADAKKLATELAMLDGVEHQFNVMVKHVVEAQRGVATARIMSKPGGNQEDSARDLRVLEGALEKIEQNLRNQYPEFISASIKFRIDNMSFEELSEYVETLHDERVQRYFAKMRSLQSESEFIFLELGQRMIRNAVGAK